MRLRVTGSALLTATALSVWLLAFGGQALAASCDDFWTHTGTGDWATAGNWSSGVPTAASNVCLDDSHTSGSYTVDIDTYNPGLVANSITVGGSGGNTVTLAILGTGGGVQVGDLLTLTNQSAGGGILPSGAVTLGMDEHNGTGQPGAINVLAGTLVNQGTITSEPTQAGQNNNIDGGFDNAGTLSLNQGFGANGPDASSGTIGIATGVTANFDYTNTQSSFTQSGGTIIDQGTFEVNDGTFVGTGGTNTGNPLMLYSDRTGITLDPSGTGSDVFHLESGAATLGSNIGAGYTVWSSGIPGYTHGGLTVNTPVTNAGLLELGSPDGTHGTLNVAAGSFTNAGTLEFLNTTNGADGLNGPLINNATVQAAEGITGSGQITNNGSLSVAAGKTIAATSFAQGAGGTLSLALASGAIPELMLTGAASVAGTLAVATTGSLTGTFPVIAAGSLTGQFGAAPFTGQSYSLGYTATGLSLTAPPVTQTPSPTPTTPSPTTTTAPAKVGTVAGGKGTITVGLSCPAGSACKAGTAKATFAEKVKKKTTHVVVASASIAALEAGAKKTLTISLNAAGKKLLKARGSLTVVLTISSGGKTVKTATVHVKKAAAAKKK